jgi:hypothetical protein
MGWAAEMGQLPALSHCRCSELVGLVTERVKILHNMDLAIARLQLEAEAHPVVCFFCKRC